MLVKNVMKFIKTEKEVNVPVWLRYQAKAYLLFQKSLMSITSDRPTYFHFFQLVVNAQRSSQRKRTLGVKRSKEFLSKSFWRQIMRKEAIKFVKTCQERKIGSLRKERMQLGKQSVGFFIETFSVDFACSISKVTNGNRFIIVTIEYLCTWLIAKGTLLRPLT